MEWAGTNSPARYISVRERDTLSPYLSQRQLNAVKRSNQRGRKPDYAYRSHACQGPGRLALADWESLLIQGTISMEHVRMRQEPC